ncbi:hypothetical protein [Actinoplanes awajinensis]|uniref:Uncharacterized protein n=1 Tax=Actinoplanes awajinensis subsp. mycoplanecinus TaxID=135947 RepID=A0A0X3V974_9ACTN|nr:hypothetical protein [Actinoplanes awajinensis]KUL41331.1 hypothetical protein ADL15_03485 [Actinoplanes awajinensis subsp. mycoplanecinus]
MTPDEPPLLPSRWPILTAQIVAALRDEGENGLAEQVATLRVLQICDCDDDFCQSFYTQPPPDGAYGPDHRNVALIPSWSGMLVLDVVRDVIMFVEVLYRPPHD